MSKQWVITIRDVARDGLDNDVARVNCWGSNRRDLANFSFWQNPMPLDFHEELNIATADFLPHPHEQPDNLDARWCHSPKATSAVRTKPRRNRVAISGRCCTSVGKGEPPTEINGLESTGLAKANQPI